MCHFWSETACCSEEISFKSRNNVLHKIRKYPYFCSLLEVGEENKKFLKLNFTGPEFFSLRQTHMGASYKDSNILSPNFKKVTQLHRAFVGKNVKTAEYTVAKKAETDKIDANNKVNTVNLNFDQVEFVIHVGGSIDIPKI